VEFRLQVRESASESGIGRHSWLPLEALSPVVRSLAHEQFDHVVKRVRVFAPSDDARAIADLPDLDTILLDVSVA